jgi:hypothetical protein
MTDRSATGHGAAATDPRAELLETVRELSSLIPQKRVGQLVAAIGEVCGDLHGRGLWDASDAELLEAAWQFRRNYQAASAPASVDPASSKRESA